MYEEHKPVTRLTPWLSTLIYLPVTCLSCGVVFDSPEPFRDVPLDIKVREFVVVLQDVPGPPLLPGAKALGFNTCPANMREPSGRWAVEGTVPPGKGQFWGREAEA